MRSFGKGMARFFLQVALITLVVLASDIFINGMPLWGLPDLEELCSVSVSHARVAGKTVETEDPEELDLALHLSGFLKYDWLGKADQTEEPLLTITYHLRDGTEKSLSANATTVWWEGRAHRLREEGRFVKLAEGIFFGYELWKESP